MKNLFEKKRVFITGHTGFKGSWLAFLLAEMGADVMGFSLPPATPVNHFDLLGLNGLVKHIEGDIRDELFLKKTLINFQPEFVFHLAAQALVRPSYQDPVTTFETNVMGSINLLDAVRLCSSVRSLVYVTSDKCYENIEWIWGYRENDRLGGRDPYSASKAAAEIIFSSYVRSFFNDVPNIGIASVRAGNVIGGGDWAVDRIIPDCVRAIESGIPIQLRNPLATRPWQHVLEPISGYLKLSSKLYNSPKNWGGSWNFGPSANEILTVESVANLMVKYMGQGSVITIENLNGTHEANLLQLNCDKANQLLEWHPRWSAKKAIEETATWYKSVLSGVAARDITSKQISSYFSEEK